jgi:hypothetical protein
MAALALLATLAVVTAAGCGAGDGGAPDGASDLGDADAGIPDGAGPGDLGPACAPACSAPQTCCPQPDGADPACVDLTRDDANCGACGVVCAGELGTRCVAGRCVCGEDGIGCGGDSGSICCPATFDRSDPYCAVLARDVRDCGACGRVCDGATSDRCIAGECVCGRRRARCAGTPADSCCTDAFGEGACVDLTADPDHCGSCGNRCASTETCVSGTCTRGAPCDGGCGPGGYCCEGVCCDRTLCRRGFCETP